jgi:hypothetical protein
MNTLLYLAHNALFNRSRVVRSAARDDFRRHVRLTRLAVPKAVTRWLRRSVLPLKDLIGPATDEKVQEMLQRLPAHHAGLSSLTASLSTTFKWTAQNALTGGNYNPVQNTGTLTKTLSVGTSAANAAVGGADQVFSFQQGITPGSSATVDLYAMTNLLQQASVTLARIKLLQIRLLSGDDDSTLSPTPTLSSMITVTNNGVALPSALDFSGGGSGLTLALTTGAGAVTGVAIGAAGSGYLKSGTFSVAPNQAGGSGAVVTVTTNSSGVPTGVAVSAGGTGYSDATVPSTVLGQHYLQTGGVHCHGDPSAGGFLPVSTTSRNFKIANNDATHAVTFELDVVAGST